MSCGKCLAVIGHTVYLQSVSLEAGGGAQGALRLQRDASEEANRILHTLKRMRFLKLEGAHITANRIKSKQKRIKC